jgi:uncharacterized protein YdaU (DUF1376 family)
LTKKPDTWMPLLVDKYLGDTTHLNTEQHGAYLLLLLTCWKRGGELPNDDSQLQSITKLPPARWKAHAPILREFFDANGAVLRQKRLSAELVRAQANLEQKSAAGKASAAARKAAKEGNGKATAVATGVGTDDQRTPQRLGKPIPTPSSLRSGLSKASPSHPPAGGRFDEFWLAWPKSERKQDRKACAAKWKAKGYDAIADTILADVATKRETTKWQGGFIEAPLVYLNNERWADGVTPDEGRPGDAAKPWHDSKAGIIAKGVELGLGEWDEYKASIGQGEQFAQYSARVFAAAGYSPRAAA